MKNLNKIIKSVTNNNDIILNDVSTIPNELLCLLKSSNYDEDEIFNYFFDNLKYNIVGAHLTRLFDFEINDIKMNGLCSDGTEDYRRKIARLPNSFNKYKKHLVKFISNPLNKRSNGRIYFDVGHISIREDNEIFTKNWGGETLYCYYDKLHDENNEELRRLKIALHSQTFPCMVIVRVNAYLFFTKFLYVDYWLKALKKGNVKMYVNENCIDKDDVKVVEVVKI